MKLIMVLLYLLFWRNNDNGNNYTVLLSMLYYILKKFFGVYTFLPMQARDYTRLSIAECPNKNLVVDVGTGLLRTDHYWPLRVTQWPLPKNLSKLL